MRPTCVWVLTSATVATRGVYCGMPVGWDMRRDDDDRLVRRYHSFCPNHQERANAQNEEEDES